MVSAGRMVRERGRGFNPSGRDDHYQQIRMVSAGRVVRERGRGFNPGGRVGWGGLQGLVEGGL